MPPKVRCTNRQKRLLSEYMATHTVFANGEFCGPLGAAGHEAQWAELAAMLRQLGPDKPVKAWKTTWRDLKRKARGDNAAANMRQMATGNILDIPHVGDEEQMILSVIGVESSVGIGPPESGIGGLIHRELVKNNEWRREQVEVLREHNRILTTNRTPAEDTTVVIEEEFPETELFRE